MKNRKGFTLIELMIVIAIIGILAAMAVPNFKKARASARQKACFSNLRVIQGAVEMYNMDNSVMMDTLSNDQVANPDTGNLKGYIKAVVGPETSCSYKGDKLSEDGEVTCGYHGSLTNQADIFNKK